MTHSFRIYQFIFISTFLLLISALLPIQAQVTSINASKIDDQETISVFFDSAQTFSKDALQSQFTVKVYDDTDWEYKPDNKGAWHLSKDGYRLSYYPVAQGSYSVNTENFQHRENSSVKSNEIYIGKSDQFVKIMGRGPVLPLKEGTIPIEIMGANAIDIEYYAINNLPKLLEEYYIASDFNNWSLSRLVKEMTPTALFRYALPADTELNKKSQHRIPLDKNITAGAYLVTVNTAGEIYKNLEIRIVFISDIGLQARLYPSKTVIIGNQFKDNAPIQNATLEVWRNQNNALKKSGTLCTFSDGLCEINERLNPSDVVVVKQGDDISILPMKEVALDLNEYAVTGAVSTPDVAYLYANRTLFRPGELITLNALLRSQDGERLPAQPLTLTFFNPQGKLYSTLTLDQHKAGFFQTEIKMPQDAKTGVWRVEARTDMESETPLGELKLYIEEFMPERMALILTGDDAPLMQDESFLLNVESRYLFGAPASHNDLTLLQDISLNRTPFAGNRDWYVGMEDFPYHLLSSSAKLNDSLDQNGEKALWVSLPEREDNAPLSAVFKVDMTVNILDGNVLGITRELSRNFWPSDVVPVIRPLFKKEALGYGASADFELFNADQSGAIAPGKFLLTLKYQDPYCTWVYSNSRGWDCHTSRGYQIREQQVIEGNNAPINYSFSPNSWGNYVLEIKDLNSGLISEYAFSGSWEDDSNGQLSAVKPLHLNLSTQKPSFTFGDDIELTINAPLAGNLTLLIEGTELLYQKNIDVEKGETKLTIPLDEAWNRHDLYLSGLLLSKDKNNETVRSLGLIPLKLDRESRQLSPQLTFDPIVKPDHPVTIDVELSKEDLAKIHHAGNEAIYATISVTDQGILNMIPQKPVSIFDAFFKQRRYSAEIIDYYSRLFKQGIGTLLSPQFGGDGGFFDEEDQGLPNLTEMKTVSLSSELLSLENGKATITFDLPDFNGEANIAVKLFSDDFVGEANAPMVIRAPIIADLVSPRFIRVGDETFISLSLVNMSGEEESIKVTVSSEQFEVQYDETITLAKEAKHFALIPIALQSFSPFAEVSLEIASKSFNATRHYQIGTVHKTEETTLYDRGLLDAQSVWQRNLEITNNFDQNFKEFITLSRNPHINILSYTNGLFTYPYGCTEQITSKAFPWLFGANPILDQQKLSAYQSATDHKKERNLESFATWEAAMMKETINRLLERQNGDGGFALWSEGPSILATSNYVTDFLIEAQASYPALVPAESLENAFKYLKKAINNAQSTYNQYGLDIQRDYQNVLSRYNLAEVSYAAWILAREGKIFNADILFMQHLMARLTPLSTAYLGASSMILGDESMGETYFNMITQKLRARDNAYGYYQSNVSEIALSLGLLNTVTNRGFEASASLKSELLRILDQRLTDRRYFSTQDRYALIKLGMEMPKTAEALKVVINGEAKTVDANTPLPANAIATLKSDDPLFMEYQIEGYPKAPVESTNFKMTFKKSLANYVGDTLKVGDRIIVNLEITPVVDLPSGLVVDYIPGGFNLVNPNLGNEDVATFFENLGIKYDQRNRIEHEEYRFDRYVVSLPMKAYETQYFTYILEASVPGTYELPVTIVEDMYLPELHNLKVIPGTITIEP